MDYTDAHRGEFRVEPICSQLQVAPSTYCAARSQPPSARSISDAARLETIRQVHADDWLFADPVGSDGGGVMGWA
ncbi:hypothetical protein [Cellulosimicrobium sp. XJ-DQ-B-000]|uniref:hypothetical protein n=1 Tax=Cellulosimicrobium sp. XJ-DQ-B-000 TaxID=3072182 RepID=UPI0035BE310D